MAMQPTKEDEMTPNASIRGAILGAILAISAAMLASPQAAQAQSVRAKAGSFWSIGEMETLSATSTMFSRSIK